MIVGGGEKGCPKCVWGYRNLCCGSVLLLQFVTRDDKPNESNTDCDYV